MAYPFPFVAGNILTAAELNALETALAPPALGFTSQAYYSCDYISSSSGVMTSQLVGWVPFYVGTSTAFDRIAIRTSTAGAGSNTIRLGIYNNTNAKPSTVVLDAGTVACTAASTTYTITISQTLAAGWYWLASCWQSGAGTQTFTRVSANMYGSSPFQDSSTLNGQMVSFTQASVSGAFATAVPVVTASSVHRTFLRAT
jgi:hypothetical protein